MDDEHGSPPIDPGMDVVPSRSSPICSNVRIAMMQIEPAASAALEHSPSIEALPVGGGVFGASPTIASRGQVVFSL